MSLEKITLFRRISHRRLCHAVLCRLFRAVPGKTGKRRSGYLFTATLPANPKSLDPQSATDAASKTIIENLYEGLVELDENGQSAACRSGKLHNICGRTGLYHFS